MQYDESANRRQIEATVNEELEIVLAETPTAGYRWMTKSTGEPVCRLLEEIAQPNTAGVGGTGHRLWKFRAVAPGMGEIALNYLRPWDNATEPARTFVLKVRVRS